MKEQGYRASTMKTEAEYSPEISADYELYCVISGRQKTALAVFIETTFVCTEFSKFPIFTLFRLRANISLIHVVVLVLQ
jgi:hypothetical protein